MHDDLLVSAAMCIQSCGLDLGVYCVNSTIMGVRNIDYEVLDGLGWGLAESEVIRGFDPLEGMMEVF